MVCSRAWCVWMVGWEMREPLVCWLRVGLTALVAWLATAGDSTAGLDDYGRYGYFDVGLDRDVNDAPMDCVITYDGFKDFSAIHIYMDWREDSLALMLFDPKWELPSDIEGSVTVDSGGYSQRLAIAWNNARRVSAFIADWRAFRDAFVGNYEMTVQTPTLTWPMDLTDSSKAWQAFTECVAYLRDYYAQDSAKNPWSGETDKSKNPWD